MDRENEGHYQRWYDRDPALSRALDHLRQASDAYQAQVALNIIKIIVEHQAAEDADEPDDAPRDHPHQRRRWYDVNATLHSAMQLLRDCPDDLQQTVIPSITRMIEQTLEEHY